MSLAITGRAAWAEQTADDVQAVADADGSIAVVPVASVEQHGDHLPVGTDSMLVTAVLEGAANEVAEDVPLLATPTMWTGHSPHHMPFGGTISLDVDSFLSHARAIGESVIDSGFDALFFVNGHGGNISLVSSVTGALGPEYPDVQILGTTYFQLATDAVGELRDTEIGGMGHGGEYETSLMLHLHPDLVDEDAMTGTMMDEPYELGTKDLVAGGPLSVYREFTEYSDSGAIGDPTAASAEKGEQLYDVLTDALGELLVEVHEQNV